MSQELEEKVARKLARIAWDRFNIRDTNFAKMRYPLGDDQYVDLQWRLYAEDARAALAVVLEAMAEPTPEMLGAWYRVKNGHHFHDECPPEDTSDYAAYRAMLSASPLGTPEGGAK